MPKPEFAVAEFKLPKGMRYCTKVDFTENAECVIGVNGDGEAAVWDAASGKVLEYKKLPGASGPPEIWMSPNRCQMAVFFYDKPVIVIDPRTLKSKPLLDVQPRALAWSHSGELLAVSDKEKNIRVFKGKANREIASFKLPDYGPDILAFLAESEELLVQNCYSVFTWKEGAGKPKKRFQFRRDVRGHLLSADGKTLIYAEGGRVGRVAKLDMVTWKSQFVSLDLKSTYNSLSPDGKLLATSVGATVVIWDMVEDKAWLKWKKPKYHSVMGVAFSPDGQQLACTPDYQVHVLDFRAGSKDRLLEAPKLKPGEHYCVEMVGPDERMDGEYYTPLNVLPVLCPKCERVDTSVVPSPYAVSKRIESPVDMAPAATGNLLVRESMKRVLELAAPGACKFYPTIHSKTRQATPWFLAAPQHSQVTAPPTGKKCAKCGGPQKWDVTEETASPVSKNEIFKAEHGFGADRELYFSLRLETLVTKLGLRGMVRYANCKQVPTPEDVAWVEDKLKQLKKGSAAGGRSKAVQPEQWFKQYLQSNARKQKGAHDFAGVEKKHGVKLPRSYKDFMATVGPKSYRDVNGEEGFTVRIVPPSRLEFSIFRKSGAAGGNDPDSKIDGVMFGTTDHGDAFCFDVGGKGSEYPVFHYQHEMDLFEPYADSFAGAVKRFAEKD